MVTEFITDIFSSLSSKLRHLMRKLERVGVKVSIFTHYKVSEPSELLSDIFINS